MTDEASADKGSSEREKALAARVAELEALVKTRREVQKGGNIVEQIWRYFAMFVPPPIIAAGVAVFVLFQAWDFYIESQMTAAETNLQQAKSSLDDAKALAQSTIVNGEPIRVETVEADVSKKQAEASRAKIEADALSAQVEGETAALQKARAEVARQQAAADKAKQDAMAATARFGLQTLSDREAFVQYVKSELQNMASRHDLAAQDANNAYSSLLPGYADQAYPPVIAAMCKDTALAKYVGCPNQYIRRAPAASFASATATAPANAEATPSAPARPLRTPKNFDCANGKHMGTDYVICASPELLDALARLEDTYAVARGGAKGDAIKTEQIAWIKRYGPDCGLPQRGRPTDTLIQGTSYCVGRAIEARIKELEAER